MKILIINSQGHWINGWMSFPASLEIVVKTLQKAGYQVESVEVKSLKELNQVLQRTNQDTLVWANAYWVNGECGKQYNLIEKIEKNNLPFLGSNSKTLLRLLEKDTCQKILKKGGIPIPRFIIIDNNEIESIDDLIKNSGLSFPLVLKPTKESRSNGIIKVKNEQEAIVSYKKIQLNYPDSNIIVEEFLPTDDITCGFLKLGDEIMLLPSYNVITGMDCSNEIFSEAHYQLPPSYKHEVLIYDENVLSQLKKYVSSIVNLLEIDNFTRVDGRLDKNGVLKFFDINGMPGLNYPNSAIIKQCFIHFPNYSEDYLFECLINTIIFENLHRYNLSIPFKIQTNHLFNLKSETIIKLNSKIRKEENYIQHNI